MTRATCDTCTHTDKTGSVRKTLVYPMMVETVDVVEDLVEGVVGLPLVGAWMVCGAPPKEFATLCTSLGEWWAAHGVSLHDREDAGHLAWVLMWRVVVLAVPAGAVRWLWCRL